MSRYVPAAVVKKGAVQGRKLRNAGGSKMTVDQAGKQNQIEFRRDLELKQGVRIPKASSWVDVNGAGGMRHHNPCQAQNSSLWARDRSELTAVTMTFREVSAAGLDGHSSKLFVEKVEHMSYLFGVVFHSWWLTYC